MFRRVLSPRVRPRPDATCGECLHWLRNEGAQLGRCYGAQVVGAHAAPHVGAERAVDYPACLSWEAP